MHGNRKKAADAHMYTQTHAYIHISVYKYMYVYCRLVLIYLYFIHARVETSALYGAVASAFTHVYFKVQQL